MSQCRSCGAPVIWLQPMTESGKRMPVDAEPRADGNVSIIELDGVQYHHTRQLWDPGPFYVSHFATCPDAEEWRADR